MDDKRQMQKELFEEFADTEKKRRPKTLFQPNVKPSFNMPNEQLVFFAIALIIVSVIAFSLGVERGKKISGKKDVRVSSKAEERREPVIKKETPADTRPKAGAEKVMKEITRDAEKQAQVPIYTIQVASYKGNKLAEKEAKRLKKKGFRSFVLSTNNSSYYIVCVGEFKRKPDAESEKKRLRKIYSDCFIRRQ